jgi:hypothetical protein
MSIYRGRYYAASGCDSRARPGTDALMSWFLGAYRSRGAANLGTYACKRLGSGWSIHAERRADDLGTAPYGGVDSTWGWALANALRLNSHELGIQLLILGRRIWSCNFPDSGWRNYSGEYHGHIHGELIPSAADTLTAARIEKIIHGQEDDEVELKDRMKAPAWLMEEYPEIGGAANRGTLTVETAIVSGYGHGRLGKDRITQGVKEILANQVAILAKVGGQDVTAAVRAELDRAAERERVERRAELGELQDLLAEASLERAELVELVGQARSGQLDAAEVVRLIGERLTGAQT